MTPATAAAQSSPPIEIDSPGATDGVAVHALIARCPPLDGNSLYCNLLQCTHFAGTSAIARQDDEVVGFVSGHRLPAHPDTLFVWQVAVDDRARGRGLARGLIRDILVRETCAGVRFVHTTVTPGNAASRAMFRRLASDLGTDMRVTAGFDRSTHLDDRHETEELLVIGPFARPTAQESRNHHVRSRPG